MSVADLDSDPSHASAGESDADDTEKLLLQSMLNQEQIYSKKDLFDTKSMHSAVSKMPSVMSVEHSSSQSTGYQTPDRTYALKALRSSAGLLVEPSTESTRKIKEDLSEKYLKELLDSLLKCFIFSIMYLSAYNLAQTPCVNITLLTYSFSTTCSDSPMAWLYSWYQFLLCPPFSSSRFLQSRFLQSRFLQYVYTY